MTQKFGLSAALTTPFKTDGTVDIDAMIAHARRCLSNGCDSVTLFGTTGEGCSVGSRERQVILSRFIEAGVAPARLVTGVLVDSIEDAADQSAEALKAGARNILLAPPPISKMSAMTACLPGSRRCSKKSARMRATFSSTIFLP